ncbi:hypothetical protein QAD02_003262 [Eretmocerus hayati]|uniref:Uncharacterized protein n=1 Tax=Eretmocerus hayati TaxID=131215 RepID=A0ACC2NMG4_9HYME|nr:hypothetical protein QAD02_003262 [Eretmocerus hayati]
MLARAFEIEIPSMNGPDVQLSKKLRSAWDGLDETSSKIPERGENHPLLLDQADEWIDFFRQLKEQQPRDDHCQLVDLCAILLRGVPRDAIEYSPHGAMHHVKWMAEAIFS